MIKTGKKTVQKLFSLHPLHIAFIDKLMAEKGFLSNSDIVRQAIDFFYYSYFPRSVYKKNAFSEEELTKREKQKAFDSIVPEVFAKETLEAPVYKNSKGESFVLIHALGNAITVIPLEKIKTLRFDDPFGYNYHMSTIGQRSVENVLKYRKEEIKTKFDLILPDVGQPLNPTDS